MEKTGDRNAVSTARTPAEPVPPPRPPVIPIAAVPPPVLGLNIVPPPFALDAEAEAKRRAEAEAKRAAEEAAAKKAADDAAAKAAAEQADAKRKSDAEARRLADAAAAQKAAEDAEAKRLADAAAAKRAEAAATAKMCQDKLQSAVQGNAVRFRTASASIDQASNAALDQLAEVVKACPGNQIQVEGHTDSQGDAGFNLTLSRNRAQAVVDYLVKAGVDASLVAAEGFGDTKPIGDNGSSEGRAQNRRIEFKVQPK